jgi:hypothetical protein
VGLGGVMQLYKVITKCTLITEYQVFANSEESAVEEYNEGNFETLEMVDYQNETIDKIVKE